VDFEWSEEQEQLRTSLRRFLAEQADVAWVRERWGDSTGLDDSIWPGLVEFGAVGLLIPEEYGGAGLGALEIGVVLEELGRALFPGPVLSSAFVASRLVCEYGTPKQRDAFLPKLARGEIRMCAAIDHGNRACAIGDGPERALTGALRPVLDAAACGTWIVPATRGDELGLYLVDACAPAARATPFGQVDGTRRLFDIELCAARADVLVEGARAAAAASEARDLLAIGLAIDAVGAAARALELATAYAKEREQFGRPIGSFQSVQHLLVDMLRAVELVRAAAIYALWSADAAPSGARREAAAVAKAAASELLPGVGASAIQVFGGIGFTWEMDIHLYDKRICSQALLGGDAAHHLETLAASSLDVPPTS